MLRKSQEGVSFITVMLLAPLVALLVLVVVKLVPVYMEYESVVSIVNGMTSDRATSYAGRNDIIGTMFKRFEVNNVKSVTMDDVNIERQGDAYVIDVEYEVRTPLFYNISILVNFTKKGEVSAS